MPTPRTATACHPEFIHHRESVVNVFQIALKSIRQRLVASSLTGLSVALGVMLMVAVLVTYSVVERAFQQRTIGYDLVVGKQGSEIQLVLSTVYRIGTPPAPIPYRFYQILKHNPSLFYENVPAPEAAIPIAMGDTTEKGGFPIVGTTREYFDHEYAPGRKLLLSGNGFRDSYDAIIGSQVARENHWDIGSTFKMVHGGADSGGHVHDELFTVVSVLKQTGTANDRTVFVQLGGFYAISGHETPAKDARRREEEFFGADYERALLATGGLTELTRYYASQGRETPEVDARRYAEEHFGTDYERRLVDAERPDAESGARIPTMQKAVTAVLIKYPVDRTSNAVMLAGKMKRGHRAQAVNPIVVMRQLMEQVVGNVAIALVVMTVLVIVVSGVGIFVSIYNSMSDRRREIAVMRALGAQRQTVFSIIMAESILLCFGGGILGVLLGHGLVFLGAPVLEAKTGLIVDPLAFHPAEFVLLPALLVLASLVGFIPAMTAYRTDVARALAE
jgi:putative ABC transport system permease protein